MRPLRDVWRTEDRLHTDDATIARLCELASQDPAIAAVVDGLQPSLPGNGSVWASGLAREGRTPALLKLGARRSEQAWMVALAGATTDVVPRVFGHGDLGGVGWLVLEKCEFGLDKSVPGHVAAVVASTVRGQVATRQLAGDVPEMDVSWVRRQLAAAKAADCPADLDRALAELERDWAFVVRHCDVVVNHGDVHFGNVVARGVDGPALLVDAMPMTTVWAWDAAYLEVMSEQPGVIRQFDDERRGLDLRATEELDRVGRLVLAWVAAYWWRIAPWRHDRPEWRAKVETWIAASRR